MTLTDKLRSLFANVLNSIGNFLLKLGIKPNFITFAGMVGNIVAAYFISRGDLRIGGWIVLLIGPLDALDGTLARLQEQNALFGALLDSFSDRISEIAILFGLLVYFLNQNQPIGCMLSFAALSGSVLVSYVRARSQSLGADPKIGILTRVERYIVTSLCLLFSQPIAGLWVLVIFTSITVFQRMWFSWKELH
jgi:CDP-diacylglycerol--glycerol-3-phosphate 3-phosphatidyltransferase